MMVVIDDDGSPLAWGEGVRSVRVDGQGEFLARELPEPPSSAAVWDDDRERWDDE